MDLFKHLSTPGDKPDQTKPTSKFIFLGAPEAEAEVLASSRMTLAKAFSDFLEVMPQLTAEPFIVSGRKGCGKTAIAEWLHFSAQQHANVFVDFIHKTDIDLEKLLQIAAAIDPTIESRTIFEWIILVRLCDQLTKNVAVQDNEGYKNLKKFLTRNRGLVDLKEYELKSIVTTYNGEVAVELFSRAFRALTGKKMELHKERAPFYRLIPYLKEAVVSMLGASENIDQKTQYIIIFDDLDVGLRSTDVTALRTVATLLRASRDYNIQEFGKRGLNAKIIILLRDDIAAAVKKVDADASKIIDSYNIELRWYDHQVFEDDENNSNIKKFINRRIEIAFANAGYLVDKIDPWNSLVERTSYWYSKTSFKYILDCTLYRPRDLLLLFKDIEKLNLRLPITQHDIETHVIPKYGQRFVSELRNEMLFRFKADVVDLIIDALRPLAKVKDGFTVNQIEKELKSRNITEPVLDIVFVLFDYSIIGQFNEGKLFFRYRENPNNPIVCDVDGRFTLHRGLFHFYKLSPIGN